MLAEFLVIVQGRLSDETLSVEGIAAEMRMSRVLLFQKIKAASGASPIEIIRQYRLEMAKQLLGGQTLTVSEVAYRVGFGNPTSFSRAFKERFGVPPSDLLLKKPGT
jgi:AraC-like DNA-binding protein